MRISVYKFFEKKKKNDFTIIMVYKFCDRKTGSRVTRKVTANLNLSSSSKIKPTSD